jgi:hypothetical protein
MQPHLLAFFRDHIASVIAGRWWEELVLGPVLWTQRLRFLPEGLQYRPEGAPPEGEPVTVPYRSVSYQIDHYSMGLLVAGSPAPVLEQSLAEENFYPGLKLLQMIQERLREQEGPRPDYSARPGPQTQIGLYRISDGPARQITPGQ